ncbi:MAG: hypothetical protein HEQ10_17210 [Dolichospermum sp. DEX182a]|nr:hypothetical protein [Dolichospermum sp. DEX182a]
MAVVQALPHKNFKAVKQPVGNDEISFRQVAIEGNNRKINVVPVEFKVGFKWLWKALYGRLLAAQKLF